MGNSDGGCGWRGWLASSEVVVPNPCHVLRWAMEIVCNEQNGHGPSFLTNLSLMGKMDIKQNVRNLENLKC